MLKEEASTSIEELEVDLPPPPPPPSSSLPSSPAATLPSPNAEIKTQPLSSAPPLDSLASSSHLLDLPLLPEPLLGEQLHATESSSFESGEAEEGSAIEVSTRGEQPNQQSKAPSNSSSLSQPLNESLLAQEPDHQLVVNHASDSTFVASAVAPLEEEHTNESGNEPDDAGLEECGEQSRGVEVGSDGGKVEEDEEGGNGGGVDATVESPLLLEDVEEHIDMKTVSFSQLHRGSPSRDPSPLESPKTNRPLRDLRSRSSNGSAPNDSQPLPSSFSSSPSNPRASSAPPDLPSKKGSFAVSLTLQSSSLPTLFLEPKRVASSVEESIEASPIGSVVNEEQESQEVEEDQPMSELPSIENEDAYIDASASQGVALELEPFDMADNDPQERIGEEDEEVDQMQKEEEEEDELEVDEVEQSADPSITRANFAVNDRILSPSSPGPPSSSSKRKDPPSPSPASSSSRPTALAPLLSVAKRPKQPFRSPMILSSPGRPSPSVLASTSTSSSSANNNLLRQRSASSPPPSPPAPRQPPPAPKPKRPKSTFKALTVSLPPPPPPPTPATKKPETSTSKAAQPPPPKRKKAPVVPFQSPLGGGGGGSGGARGGGFSQAKEIAETERKVQMLKQALRFVGTAEGRRKEERERDLVGKWKDAGREISQLLWDETPSAQDPSKDPSSSSSSNPSAFSFNDQPFGFSSSSNHTQSSPFLSSSQSFETSFGFSSTTPSHHFSHSDDSTQLALDALEPDSDSSLPSPKTVSQQIDQTLAKRANGGRVGLGVRAYLEERRERRGAGGGSKLIDEDEEEEEDGEVDEAEENGSRKRKRQSWSVGEMLRRRFGVDPILFGWDDECEDWL